MRSDIFQEKKCVHLKLDKQVHASLRAKLFQHGVSMQDTFDEFARQLVEGGRSANVILDSLINKKLNEAINQKFHKRDKKLGELDAEALYSLINSQEKRSCTDEADNEENK